MNTRKTSALSITVKFSAETSPVVLAAAKEAALPLATWARGVLEREVGVDGPEADLTPIARPEPLTEDELTRRHAVRRLGEIVGFFQAHGGGAEDTIAELRAAVVALVATLPKR